MLGLHDDPTPQPAQQAPKQTKSKPRPVYKENVAPLPVKSVLARPPSMGAVKPRKKKVTPTQAIKHLDREISKVNTKLEVQALVSRKPVQKRVQQQQEHKEPSEIIDISASLHKNAMNQSSDNRLAGLLSNLDGLTPAGLEHLMACSSNTGHQDYSDDASCISDIVGKSLVSPPSAPRIQK